MRVKYYLNIHSYFTIHWYLKMLVDELCYDESLYFFPLNSQVYDESILYFVVFVGKSCTIHLIVLLCCICRKLICTKSLIYLIMHWSVLVLSAPSFKVRIQEILVSWQCKIYAFYEDLICSNVLTPVDWMYLMIWWVLSDF